MNSGFGRRPRPIGRGPRTINCYICGRGFGLSSIAIHEKQCLKLWKLREAKKPRHERRPVPRRNQNLADMQNELRSKSSGSGRGTDFGSKKNLDKMLDTYNAEALSSFNASLQQCPNCGRTFNEKAFKHHMKACRPGRVAASRLKQGSGKGGGNFVGAKTIAQKWKGSNNSRPNFGAKDNDGSTNFDDNVVNNTTNHDTATDDLYSKCHKIVKVNNEEEYTTGNNSTGGNQRDRQKRVRAKVFATQKEKRKTTEQIHNFDDNVGRNANGQFTNNKNDEVLTFLSSLGLEKYYENIRDLGGETLSDLLYLQEADVASFMKILHSRKLFSAISKLSSSRVVMK
eukprot:g3297.t1